MSSSVTPEAAEPTLAEAFGELAEGIAAIDSAPEIEAPEQGAPAPSTAEPTPSGNVGETASTPAAPAPAPETEQPLTYTINGQSRTFEGGRIVPGQGAIIAEAQLPVLRDRLQQADRLVETNKELYQTTREYQQLGGRQGYEKLTAEVAQLNAAGVILLQALSNEDTLLALATDPRERQQLIKEVTLASREAQMTARTTLQESMTRESRATQTVQQSQTAIANAVTQLSREFPELTTADVQAVTAHAGRVHSAVVRPATTEEAQAAGVRVGEPIIDLALLHSLLSDRHEIRSQAASVQRQQTVDAENQARLAAANPTRSPAGRTAPRPGAGKQTPPAQRPLDQMTSAEITRAMKTGRIFNLVGDE